MRRSRCRARFGSAGRAALVAVGLEHPSFDLVADVLPEGRVELAVEPVARLQLAAIAVQLGPILRGDAEGFNFALDAANLVALDELSIIC